MIQYTFRNKWLLKGFYLLIVLLLGTLGCRQTPEENETPKLHKAPIETPQSKLDATDTTDGTGKTKSDTVSVKQSNESNKQSNESKKTETEAEAFAERFNKMSDEEKDSMKKAFDKIADQLSQRMREEEKYFAEKMRKRAVETVKHLKTLPLAEQRAYLKKEETLLYNSPSFKKLEAEFPGSIDEEWNERLQSCIDAGYELPDGVDFK